MSKFDNGMFKTWQHILNVEDNKENHNKEELLIREDERMRIAKRLKDLGLEDEVVFKATGIKIE
ncbi:hypothetical protein [Clostridium sp. LIBA-8841]|uniref:hypothetical protein n=1 Tax=Clostridium sp. LIBA-8841 TaxID=2987530 RepID=UPI002AC633B2|nr:hypothetical protein [Clostridium sp. LIBA-8841]MDZ5252382.1 hypothetical protein [Clostridium sp. LIBA-8841]